MPDPRLREAAARLVAREARYRFSAVARAFLLGFALGAVVGVCAAWL